MKKAPLYSRSRPPRAALPPPSVVPAGVAPPETGTSPAAAAADARSGSVGPDTRWHRVCTVALRHERRLWALAVLALGATLFLASRPGVPLQQLMRYDQVEHAVRESLQEKPLPARTLRAVEAVRGSLVRVVGLMSDGDDGGDDRAPSGATPPATLGAVPTPKAAGAERPLLERGIGSGVVIVDNGTILTNLHVVSGARRIRVTFADGHESDARLMSTQPENDLAVLRALSIPDDLPAATMRSTADLAPGEPVVALGFPFGIGPSVSAGVVSGLKRQFRAPDGRLLSNLIQFDAAANPGNSGGPLVTTDGAVVGIVTAILNPSQQRVFIGIGFAVPIENAAAAVGMHPF